MFRRDLLATLLSVVPVTGVRPLLGELADAAAGTNGDDGSQTGDWTEGSEADARNAADNGTGDNGTDSDETGGNRTDSNGTGGNDADSNGTDSDGTDDSGTDTSDPDTRTAVVDRIEEDVAVVLFEGGTGTETVPVAALPEAAREAGLVLRVPEGDSLSLATVDRAATAKRRRNGRNRFDELSERPPGSVGSGNGTTP